MNNRILILGANGQDGRVLCDFFDKNNINYDIAVRNENRFIHENKKNIFIGDLNNYKFIKEIFELNTYDKVFNFANETFVRDNSLISDSFTKTLIFFNLCKVIEENSLDFWLCQPLSSEIFGIPSKTPQNSKTIIDPINNYGLAKTIELYGSQILRSKGIKVFNPIFFNHESSYRDNRFFSAKAINYFINYDNNIKNEPFKFHNALSVRDWGYAKEYIKIVVSASEKRINDKIVIGSGVQISVLNFIKIILENFKIDYKIYNSKEGLIIIKDAKSSKIIAKEMGINKIDIKRQFKADTQELKQYDLEIPKIKGKNLVIQLIQDFKNQEII